MTELEKLSAAFWAHVREYPLPEPCRVSFDPMRPEVDVQVNPSATAAHLSELVLWGRTLHDVTVEWWHTTYGDLHIILRGNTHGGARIRVYGGITFADCAGLIALTEDDSQDVTLEELAALRDLLRSAEEVAA
ncbi:hypothetical protein FNH05_36200 [Amycolatopsis rhizosphaerae]|uniref:Uncharacterized protein n=1 Tax=Amycolatopsis rhizosphaerae TaxID=2053003 RepID=A0A557ZZ17_9PSEU|nr:hypothetical protein [Amycolatopsis rhizosphaerae]TVT17231.1 hypothetical protein FNH05_36200 [Amycolatopsis rhizosphaerae]